jgi:serine/threonine protein phosphatase 1
VKKLSKYIISDLHGCYDKFIKLLDELDFKETDELYIIGDVLDRGENPLEILDYIISNKNIILLKGNHEQMYIDFYENNDISLWYHNGGDITHSKIINRDFGYEESLYKYLKKLPYVKVIDKFILVHAGLYFSDGCDYMDVDDFIKFQEEDNCLWDRSNIGNERKYKDYTVICGHTPVQSITNNYNNVEILHRYGTIYIDCGCVFEKANGKLACLRLDDMAKFYVS